MSRGICTDGSAVCTALVACGAAVWPTAYGAAGLGICLSVPAGLRAQLEESDRWIVVCLMHPTVVGGIKVKTV